MRQDFPKLLQSPFRRWMRSDVVVNDPPAAQLQNHKYIKDAEAGRDDDEEITCDDHLGMVADERQPSLSGIRRAGRTTIAKVFRYRPGRNADPEFRRQLVGDAFLARTQIVTGRFFSSGGRPGDLDFHCQKRRNPRRCQRTRVSVLTTTSTIRQSTNRLTVASNHRVGAVAFDLPFLVS